MAPGLFHRASDPDSLDEVLASVGNLPPRSIFPLVYRGECCRAALIATAAGDRVVPTNLTADRVRGPMENNGAAAASVTRVTDVPRMGLPEGKVPEVIVPELRQTVPKVNAPVMP